MGLLAANPMTAHNFMVIVGAIPIAFSKVSSLEIAIETEVLVEGGRNHSVHSLSSQPKSEKVLKLERGVPANHLSLVNALLKVGTLFPEIIILVLDAGRIPRKVYILNGALLKSRSFSGLNASSSELLIESMEFVYENLTEVLAVDAFLKLIPSAGSTKPKPSAKPGTTAKK